MAGSVTTVYRRIAGVWTDYLGNTLNPLAFELNVVGNKLIAPSGKQVILRGVNISSAEAFPPYDFGSYEAMVPAAMSAIARYGANCVRIPLNQAAWYGTTTNSSSGQPYRNNITTLVRNARSFGMYVIIEIHWNDPRPTVSGSTQRAEQQPMLDRQNSLGCWTSLANTFKDDTGIIFDLYNEPHSVSWQEWRDGGKVMTYIQSNSNVAGNTDPIPYTWTTAGMQEVVDAVRATGAMNVIICSARNYANNVGASDSDGSVNGPGWAEWKPNDPSRNLVCAVHVYAFNAYGPAIQYSADSPFDASSVARITALAQQYPVILTETGDKASANPPTFAPGIIPWAEANLSGHFLWTWNDWGGDSYTMVQSHHAAANPYEAVMAPVGDWYGTYVKNRRGARPNPAISYGRPVDVSSNPSSQAIPVSGPHGGNDWRSQGIPAWYAIDLSGVAAESRRHLLLHWNEAGSYQYDTRYDGSASYNQPGNYVIEGNTGAGGGSAPVSGWIPLVTVTGNTRHARLHRFYNAAAVDGIPFNWVRMRVTAGAPSNADLNLDFSLNHFDIVDVSSGNFDTWLFLGDSITANAIKGRADGGVRAKVQALAPGYTPLVEEGGVGGISTAGVAAGGGDNALFLDWLATSPAHFVTLSYGTNDAGPNAGPTFSVNMRYLVDQVLSAGKRPVLPKIPWSPDTDRAANTQPLNDEIDNIYASYGKLVLRGPDLWSFYQAHPEYFGIDPVHPNDAGIDAWTAQWAQTIVNSIYPEVP